MSALSISVPLAEAKSKLSELLRRARDGEEIIIAQAGVPVARLVPIVAAAKKSAAASR